MTEHASPTASVSYLRVLFDHLRQRGIEAPAVLQGRAIDLEDREARLPEAEAASLFNRAAALLGDEALGVHVGEQIRPGHYGALGYVAMACATLGEALACQQRYQGLVLSIAPLQMRVEGDAVELSWSAEPRPEYRHLAEFNLAALLSFVRWITGRPLA